MLHPRNQLRLLAGVPIDPELERTPPKKKIEESTYPTFVEDGESLIEEGMEPYKALEGTMAAIEEVLKHLQHQVQLYKDNPTVRNVEQKDHDKYERILALLHKGDIQSAKHAYRDMDTAARELTASKNAVKKKSNRKAAATLFGYHLLHEGFADLFLSSKFRSKIADQDKMQAAYVLFHKLMDEDGRERHDAQHTAASLFDIQDKVFQYWIDDHDEDTGDQEASADSPDSQQPPPDNRTNYAAGGMGAMESVVTEDHFDKGDHVSDKSGKLWEVTGSDEGEGNDEVYNLKDIDSGNTSNDTAGNLRKVTKESVEKLYEEIITEYQGIWNNINKVLLQRLFELRERNPTMAHRIIQTARGPLSTGDVDEANKVIRDALASVNMRESMHDYDDKYNDYEEDEEKPVNVADGSTNDEQVYDDKKEKPEAPHQLKEPAELSPQDNSEYDKDKKISVPSSVTGALTREAKKARDEAQRLDIRDKASAQFYRDLARAFEDINLHLGKGTLYDIKHAQVFAQSLMGPMLHKLPSNVWKWLANAGQTRSLKDYMKEVGNEAKLKKGFDPTKEKAA